MESELATIARVAPGRLIGLAPDGAARLVWDTASLRIPTYDLPHLAAVLETWCIEEDPPGLRRGYYRLVRAPDGGLQLWLHGIGLQLSREEVRMLTSLVAMAADEISGPLCRQPRTPFGIGYRRLVAPRPGANSQN